MPARYIREGINDSDRVNALSDKAEIFYRRLLLVVDDYGRYESHPALLRAHCYSKKLDSVSEGNINEWLDECIKNNLIRPYNVNGKAYLLLLDFNQRKRGVSKYPNPEDSDPPQFCGENAAKKLSNDGVYSSTIFENDIRERDTSSGADGCPTQANQPVQNFCKRLGKKTPCNRYGKNVLLTEAEYLRLIADLGKDKAIRAISEYDMKFPNSPAIQKHTDHNLAIRDYLNRGFICSNLQPQGQVNRQTPKNEYDSKKYEVAPEDVSTPEEIAEIAKLSRGIGRQM